jgi:transposase InsO family protein
MFFVLVDAHSKWPEIVEMKTTTSTKTIEVPRSIFSRNGIPAQIVSDNGSQFSSDHTDEFATFMKRNGSKHYKSSPYHPATNGLAERFIQTFKNSMRAMKDENRDINQKIANFLLTYRNTPIPQQMKHQRNFSWGEI